MGYKSYHFLKFLSFYCQRYHLEYSLQCLFNLLTSSIDFYYKTCAFSPLVQGVLKRNYWTISRLMNELYRIKLGIKLISNCDAVSARGGQHNDLVLTTELANCHCYKRFKSGLFECPLPVNLSVSLSW